MKQKSEIKAYNIENIKEHKSNNKDFDIYRFEYFLKDIEHLRKSHRHDFYALIITISGTGKHTIDFNEYLLKPRRIFFINYGQVHSWTMLNQLKGFVVLFTQDFYNLIFTGNEKIKSDQIFQIHKPFIDVNLITQNKWVSLLEMIISEFSDKGKYHCEIICMLLKILMLNFKGNLEDTIPPYTKSDRKIELVNKFKLLINQYYKEWKLPKYYAQLLFVTPNYLNALCNTIDGNSCSFLIRERVILEAKRLLSHTDETVTQISFELGFEDKSHFGKYFKKYAGMTPEAFRINYSHIKI